MTKPHVESLINSLKKTFEKLSTDGRVFFLDEIWEGGDEESPPECTGIRVTSRRKDHPQLKDQDWYRWIVFMDVLCGDSTGLYAHYGENIRHARTKYPERINDNQDVELALKYFYDPPGPMVLVNPKLHG